MSGSFQTRLASLRSHRGLSVKDLSVETGISHGELLALENGGRRSPPPDLVRKLAEFFCTTPEYLRTGAEPTPAQLRAGFFRFYDRLGPEVQQGLKLVPIQGRVRTVIEFLGAACPTLFEHSQVASRLGLSEQALEDVLRGAGPIQTQMLKLLAQLVGLDLNFFVRGDFFGGVVPGEHDISPSRLSEYYQVVREAMEAGISPSALRKAVQILAIREEA